MKKLFITVTLFIMSLSSQAQTIDTIALYTSAIPNSKPTPANYKEVADERNFVKNVSTPQLLCFFPPKDKAIGTAVIICPGGSYAGISMKYEGTEVAKRFNDLGIAAFVLKYRLPLNDIMVDKTIGPLQDAQRAVQMVRENAAKWGINQQRVGIMGFSAGGHLASTAGTHYKNAVIANDNNTNLRPDFMILIYPVISFGQFAHTGSRDNLLGKNAAQEMVDLYSNQKQVTADTPPTFIIHAEDDQTVPVQNTLLFYDALVNKKVKAEMHIYEAGGHGFGLTNPKEHTDWFTSLSEWLKVNEWMK